jgi:hypothetical protein
VRPSQCRNYIGKLAGCIMQFPLEIRAHFTFYGVSTRSSFGAIAWPY